MWRVVLVLIYLVKVHGTVQTIRWEVSSGFSGSAYFNMHKVAVVKYNEPFTLIFDKLQVRNAKCKAKNVPLNSTSVTKQNVSTHNWETIIKVDRAIEQMSTQWSCTGKSDTNHDKTFEFTIRVRGMGIGQIYIRNQLVTGKGDLLSDFSESFEDSVVVWYMDGEMIDLSCRCHGNTVETHNLVYYSPNGTKMIETDNVTAKYHIDFRKMMYSNQDSAKLDCVYKTNNDQEFIYRTIFTNVVYFQPFKITVNGLKLVMGDVSNQKYKYQYKYMKGETLVVTCEFFKKIRNERGHAGHVTFDLHNIEENATLDEISHLAGQITVKLDSKHLNNKIIMCTTKEYGTAEILFNLEDIEPHIEGLSSKDIILRYPKNHTTWVIDYNYITDCTQTVRCDGVWTSMNADKMADNKTDILILESNMSNTTVICETLEGNNTKRTIVNIFVNIDDTYAESQYATYSDLYLVAIAGIISLFVIIAVCVILCQRASTKRNRQDSQENLTREFETPIPTYPNQWENRMNNGQPNLSVANRRIKKDSVDHVYHYPEAVQGPTSTTNYNIAEHRMNRMGNNVTSGKKHGNLTECSDTYSTVHDSIDRIVIKRTSEFVEPSYSVIHKM